MKVNLSFANSNTFDDEDVDSAKLEHLSRFCLRTQVVRPFKNILQRGFMFKSFLSVWKSSFYLDGTIDSISVKH